MTDTNKRGHIVGEEFAALVLLDGQVAERHGAAWTFQSFGTIGAYPGFRDESDNWVPLSAVLYARKKAQR